MSTENQSAAALAVNDPNPGNVQPDNAGSILIPESKPLDEAAKAAADKAELNDNSAAEYEPTGDVGLDMALAFVGKAGISSDHPAMVAAQTGDFSILKATLAAKGVPGWEQFVALGESAYTKSTAANAEKATRDRAAVEAIVGGPEEWKAIQTWAGANATPAEKAEINALLNAGGLAAKGAVKYLMDVYAAANNVVREPKEAVSSNAGRASGASVAAAAGPLDARGYAAAVQELSVKLGGRMEDSKEYATLQQRRSMHRG